MVHSETVHSETDRAIREEIRQRLERRSEVLFALLFGSRARHERTPRSGADWDVAVFLAESLDARERFDLRRRLVVDLEEVVDSGRLDLVVLNEAPSLLGHRALEGERLMVRDQTAYVRYFVRTLAASGDEAFYRELHQRARRARLAEGTFGRP
jgi:predicted nucleotidyltransferase